MKSLLFTLSIILFTTSLFAQKLDYRQGKFIYNSQIYSINELPNTLNLENNNLYEKILSVNDSRKVWQIVTISSAVVSGIGISSLVFFSEVDEPIIGITGQVLAAVLILVGIPVTVIAGTGWIITSIKRKKRVNSFLNEYNNKNTSLNDIQLKTQLTNSGIGLVLSF